MNNDDYYTSVIVNIYFSYLIGFQDGQASKDADAREKTREFISLYVKSQEDTMMTSGISEKQSLKEYDQDLEFLKEYIKEYINKRNLNRINNGF